MKKTHYIFIGLAIIGLFVGCIRTQNSKSEPTPQAGENSPAQTPSEMPTPEKPKEKPFTISIKNALLFDASKDPFGRNLTNEKGMCLLVIGSARNNTNKICHRGGMFCTLKTTFAEDVTIEKHSGGMGFDPEVSSEDPWRPGTWRSFQLVTRAMDPIYYEFVPTKAQAEIILEVRDPLKFRLRQSLITFDVPWRALLGSRVSGTGVIMEPVTPLTSEKYAATKFEVGDLVRISFQKGSGYKVFNDDGLGGWVPYHALALDLNDYKLLPDKSPPVEATSETVAATLLEFSSETISETNQTVFKAKIQIVNGDNKKPITVRNDDFLLDFGPEDQAKGNLVFIDPTDGPKRTFTTTLRPQETGTFLFTLARDRGTPLELSWWLGSNRRLSLPVK